MSKYRRLRQSLESKTREGNRLFRFAIPAAATDSQLELVHETSYLEAVKNGGLSRDMEKRIGFPWSSELVERSRRSTGATIDAAVVALTEGCAANLAGGTHHAYADKGEGFCVFNDVCVAARWLQLHHGIRKVLVVDCDVHQGNGTAKITETDDSIFSFSMHSEKNYPFQKEKSDLDIGLEKGTTDSDYLAALSKAIEEIDRRFQPDFVFYVSGADPYEHDRLGRLSLSKQGLEARDRLVIETYRHRHLPLAISMGGGYADQIEDIVEIHSNTILVASDYL